MHTCDASGADAATEDEEAGRTCAHGRVRSGPAYRRPFQAPSTPLDYNGGHAGIYFALRERFGMQAFVDPHQACETGKPVSWGIAQRVQREWIRPDPKRQFPFVGNQ